MMSHQKCNPAFRKTGEGAFHKSLYLLNGKRYIKRKKIVLNINKKLYLSLHFSPKFGLENTRELSLKSKL